MPSPASASDSADREPRVPTPPNLGDQQRHRAGGHAIYIHLVQFQVVNRQTAGSSAVQPPARVKMTRMTKMTFDRRSRYIWYFHLLDREGG